MVKPYAVVPMPLYSDPNTWIKIIVPLDTFDIVEKTNWCWHNSMKDAFPIGYEPNIHNITQNSFRVLSKLLGNNISFDETKRTWDLREAVECCQHSF
jgi:hypothetical protein